MSSRRAVAVSVWALSWMLALAALLIGWIGGLSSAPLPGTFLSPAPEAIRAGFDEIGVTVALVYGPVSALILARRPHPVGVILAVHAVGSGLAAFGVQWGLLWAEHPDLPLAGFLAFAGGWAFVPGTFMTAALPLLVTRRRVRAWEWGVVAAAAMIATVAWFLSFTQQSVPEPVNPFAIASPAYQAAAPGAYVILSFCAVAISLISWVVLLVRWVGARGADRTGLTWLVLGHGFLTMSYAVLVLPADLSLPQWITDVGLVAPVVGQVLYPTAILVVILGQRLWGVDLVVSRVVLWSLLTIGAVTIYLLTVLVAPLLLPGADGLWLLAPLAVALSVLPLRAWLQRRIDRLIYGEGADPAVLIARLGDRVGDLEPGASGLRELADALRGTLRLGSVQIRSDALAHRISAGRPGGAPVKLPLRAGDALVGELVVRPPGRQRLDRRTLAALDSVTGLFAAAIRLVESHEVLEEARTALVAVRAEERRMLRRELHDGLGPALAGVGFGLAAVDNLLPRDPDRAAALLAELTVELRHRVRAVRQFANDVMPSPLEGRSLADAVADLAARFDSTRSRVTCSTQLAGSLPDEVEEAVYFIVAEALTNAARHSDASQVGVHLGLGDSEFGDPELVVRVGDDGRGIRDDAEPGVGLSSMRERAEQLGGSLVVRSAETGTTVVARLPARVVSAVGDAVP